MCPSKKNTVFDAFFGNNRSKCALLQSYWMLPLLSRICPDKWHTSVKTMDSFVNSGSERHILLCFMIFFLLPRSGSFLTLEVIS